MYSKEQERSFFERTRWFLQHGIEVEEDNAAVHEELVGLINYHEWRYYVQNDPIISDFEYDLLYKQLEEIEFEQPDLASDISPTQRVSSDLSNSYTTVRHLSAMLSLANSYNADDLKSFDESIRKLLGLASDQSVAYTVEPKFDGGSIALVYENDLLVRAATRGNGQEGDEITANARTIRSIPLEAKFSLHQIGRIELRGEVLIPKNSFERINKERIKADLPLFANARNAATGGLRMKDPKDSAKRGMEAFIYQIAYVENLGTQVDEGRFESQWEGIQYLGQLGFKVPTKEHKLCKNIADVITFCEEWEARRESYPYEIDGMVIKVDRLDYQRAIGSTSHHPRWAIAYKFKAKQATTKLLNVEYQVGKIGSITPVAKLDPVQLAGVTVASVSLHNEDFITSKDLRIGDFVVVERAGDVIPYIVKSLPDLRDGSEVPITFPRTCPINKHEAVALVRADDEAAWRCPSCTCGAQDLQRIIFHVSKSAMNVDGFGKSIVERFYQEGWIRNIADVYRLDYGKIEKLEGFGKKSADNLNRSIEKSKKNPIYRLLHSLSVHHLGKRASKILAERIHHVLELKDWTIDDYTKIKDIGPVLSENMVAFFSDVDHIRLLEEMESLGVNMTQTEADRPIKVAEDAALKGKTILFTGTLLKMSRKEAQALAEKHGAKNISAVSSNLNILVVGEKAGSKLKKAQELGSIEILSEDAFMKLLL